MVVELSAVQIKVCNLIWMSSFMQLSMHMHEHGVPAHCINSSGPHSWGCPDLWQVTAKGLLHVWVTCLMQKTASELGACAGN